MSWLHELGVKAGSNLVFAGLFHCADDPTWPDVLLPAARERGYFAGLPSVVWAGLSLVGIERRGWALAETAVGQVFLLSPSGAAFELESFDQLAKCMIATFDVPSGIELEIEPTTAPEPADFISALASGNEDAIQTALEQTLGSEPLMIAYTRLAWRIAGATTIPLERRDDALSTVVTLAKRRNPALIGTWLPKEIHRGCDAVSAWAKQPLPFDTVSGPFVSTPMPGEPVAIADEDRPYPSAVWVDVDAELERWAAAWTTPVTEVVDRCRTHPKRFSIIQRIVSLGRPAIFRGNPLALDVRSVMHHEKVDRAWLASQPDVWPFIVLRQGVALDSEIALLRDAREPIVERMLRERILARPTPGQANAYVRNVDSVPEELVKTLIGRTDEIVVDFADPAHDFSTETIAMFHAAVALVCARLDLAEARAFAHKHFDQTPEPFARALVRSPAKDSLAFVRKKAKARNIDVRVAAAEALAAIHDPGAEALVEAALGAHRRRDDQI
ncbi:MAG: hypothetical protein QM831_28385 [Kofleriaceae bacterium]